MKLPRYTVMCVPGRLEDGSDSAWFVVEQKTQQSALIGEGDALRTVALRVCRELNETRPKSRRR